MGTIFISHSEKDMPTVTEIIRCLEAAGYRAWYFERDVLPGTSYLVQITEAVAACDALLLVASTNSIGSDQTAKEVVGAFERRKPFFPILLDLTPPQLKELQPEWRHALGGTAMIMVGPQGVTECVSQVIEGLKARGLYPEGAGQRPSAEKPVAARAGKPVPNKLKDGALAPQAGMQGERKQATVLFAIVSGFTSGSQGMDPEQVRDLAKMCVAVMAEEVRRYEGTVAHLRGDGVMALFGVPLAHEDDPQRALYAALGIRDRLREQARHLREQGVDFEVGVGVNTGVVVVESNADSLSPEYTALGDTVNVASRIQSSAGPDTIRVAEATHRLTQGYFDFRAAGELDMKGKKETLRIYDLLGTGQAQTRMGLSVARGLTPFVGRRQELERLLDSYERAKGGQGQVVGIVGEPGVGKSRLVLQMREAVGTGECSFVEGQCLHYGESIPYLPLLGILRSYLGLEEGEAEPSARSKTKDRISRLDDTLQDLVPPLCDLLSLEVEDEQYLRLEPKDKRDRIFDAIRKLFIRESQDRPLTLIVEDLHWVDKTSEEFLDHLIGRLARTRILLLLLYRPEYTHSWGSKTYYSQLSLDEFPPEASLKMVQALFPGGQPADNLRDLVLSKSAGNALFMEEFSRTLLEKGYVTREDGQYVLTADPASIDVPETVQGLIRARIDSLEDDVKQAIQMASAIGREFSLGILKRLFPAGTGPEDQLSRLQQLELVYERSAFPEAEYIFKHAMTQEVAYNSLLLKKRKELHGRIGKAIEELHPERTEEFCEALAHHYSMAEDPEKAALYLGLSGDKAHRRYSTREAYNNYSEALRALGRLPDTEEIRRTRLDLITSMAAVMWPLNYPEGCLAILQDGLGIAEGLGDRQAALGLSSMMSQAYAFAGDLAQATRCNQNAFDAAEALGDRITTLMVGINLSSFYFQSGNAVRAADVAGRAIALLGPPTPELEWYSALLFHIGGSRAMLGDFDEGESLLDQAVNGAADQYLLASSHFMYALVEVYRGRPQAVLNHAREARALCEKTGLNVFLGACWAAEAYGHYFINDLSAARVCAEKAVSLVLEHHAMTILPEAYMISGMIARGRGDLPEATRLMKAAVETAREGGMKQYEGLPVVALSSIMVEADKSQISAAELNITEGMGILEDLKLKPWLAVAHLYAGETYAIAAEKAKALANLNQARQMCQGMGMDYWLARTDRALEKLSG